MKTYLDVYLFGLLISAVLLLANKQKTFSKILLTISIFSLSCHLGYLSLLDSFLISRHPFLEIVFIPFQFLCAPASYLYLRNVLSDNYSGVRKYDWLHVMPAVIAALLCGSCLLWQSASIGFIQLQTVTTIADKFKEMHEFMPYEMIACIKLGLYALYIVLHWQIVMRWAKESELAPYSYKFIFKWALDFTVILSTILLIFCAISVLTIIHYRVDGTFIILESALKGVFLILVVYLFFKPQILYGSIEDLALDNLKIKLDNENVSVTVNEKDCHELKSFTLNAAKVDQYKAQLENLMACEFAYLKQGYSIHDVSEKLGIPKHHLSILINREYGVNFNDYINNYRVAYLKKRMQESGSDRLTLDGLAKEAGFSSRATFFRAFTKLTGSIPSDFLKDAMHINK